MPKHWSCTQQESEQFLHIELCLPAAQELTLNPSLLAAFWKKNSACPRRRQHPAHEFLTADKQLFVGSERERLSVGQNRKSWIYFGQIACIYAAFCDILFRR